MKILPGKKFLRWTDRVFSFSFCRQHNWSIWKVLSCWETESRGPNIKRTNAKSILKGPMSNVNMFSEQWKKEFRKKIFIGDDDGALAISRIYQCSIITRHRNIPVGGITNTNYFIFCWLPKNGSRVQGDPKLAPPLGGSSGMSWSLSDKSGWKYN